MNKNILLLALLCSIPAFGMDSDQPDKHHKRVFENDETTEIQENKKQKIEIPTNNVQNLLILFLKDGKNFFENYTGKELKMLTSNIFNNPIVLEGNQPGSQLLEHDYVKNSLLNPNPSITAEIITDNVNDILFATRAESIENPDAKTLNLMLNNNSKITYDNLAQAQSLQETHPNDPAYSNVHNLLLEACIKQPHRFDSGYQSNYDCIESFSRLSNTSIEKLSHAVLDSDEEANNLPFQFILDHNIIKKNLDIVKKIATKNISNYEMSIVAANDYPKILNVLFNKYLTDTKNFNVWYFCDDIFPLLNPTAQKSMLTRIIDPNIKLALICYGLSAAGNLNDVTSIDNNIDHNFTDAVGHHFVHNAFFSKNVSTIKKCLNFFSNFDINYRNPHLHNSTILQELQNDHLDAIHNANDLEVFHLITNKPSINFSLQDDFGNTALHKAVENAISQYPGMTGNDIYMVNYLMNKDPDFSIKNNDGLTAYDLASNNQLNPITALFELDHMDTSGKTALLYTLDKALNRGFLTTEIAIDTLQNLIYNGANFLIKDTNDNSISQMLKNLAQHMRANQNQYTHQQAVNLQQIGTFFDNLKKNVYAFCNDPNKYIINQNQSLSKIPVYALFNLAYPIIYNKLLANNQTNIITKLVEQSNRLRISQTKKNQIQLVKYYWLKQAEARKNFHDCIIKFDS